MRSKNKLFWICQLSGWFVIGLINFVIQIPKDNFSLINELFSNSIFIGLGLLVCWLLRNIYHRIHILNMPLLKLILPVLVLSLLTALILTVTLLFIISFTDESILSGDVKITLNLFIGNLIGIYPIIIIWSALYLAINYLMRWQQSEIDKIRLESSLKDAQLNTLIGQINPHFMFNSLNNIRGLMLENVDSARAMLTNLSSLLRYSLTSHKTKMISLEQELEMVEKYVELSAIQLEERLVFNKSIEITNLQLLIPPMIIQMLIENAIKHGINQIKGGGELNLKITQQQEQLEICVSNPGSLQKSKNNLDSAGISSSGDNSTGLGLKNIQHRLALLYSNQASFSIVEDSNLVIATIILPIRLTTD